MGAAPGVGSSLVRKFFDGSAMRGCSSRLRGWRVSARLHLAQCSSGLIQTFESFRVVVRSSSLL